MQEYNMDVFVDTNLANKETFQLPRALLWIPPDHVLRIAAGPSQWMQGSEVGEIILEEGARPTLRSAPLYHFCWSVTGGLHFMWHV